MGETVRTPYNACPLCGQGGFREIRLSDCSNYPLYQEPLPRVLRWVQCPNCHHVFTDSYYTESGLQVLFSRTHPGQMVSGNLDQQRAIWSEVVERVIQFLPCKELAPRGAPSWLDIGCGNGGLVFTAAEFGFQAIGLDTREEAVTRIQALGYTAYCGSVTTVSVNPKVDAVSMADVVEHLPYPVEVLQRVSADLLKPAGVLMVSCPNRDCVTWKDMDRKGTNPYWAEMEHYHNFTRSRLAALLEQCGFKVVGYGVSKRYKACMELYAQKVGP